MVHELWKNIRRFILSLVIAAEWQFAGSSLSQSGLMFFPSHKIIDPLWYCRWKIRVLPRFPRGHWGSAKRVLTSFERNFCEGVERGGGGTDDGKVKLVCYYSLCLDIGGPYP